MRLTHTTLIHSSFYINFQNDEIFFVTTSWFISVYYALQQTWKPFNTILGETYEMVSHHPPISDAHVENEYFVYDITSKVKTKFLGNSIDVYPLGRTHLKLKKDGVILESVPPPTKVINLIFGRTWLVRCWMI
uniref:Uncharacterized protein n=1 Tax=Lactuca sativa TaxID=4236 RepID=A0A9R1WPP3_LACSA|nr:hypothetical protein LSAT_V11C100042580 [Lactuca sativa]